MLNGPGGVPTHPPRGPRGCVPAGWRRGRYARLSRAPLVALVATRLCYGAGCAAGRPPGAGRRRARKSHGASPACSETCAGHPLRPPLAAPRSNGTRRRELLQERIAARRAGHPRLLKTLDATAHRMNDRARGAAPLHHGGPLRSPVLELATRVTHGTAAPPGAVGGVLDAGGHALSAGQPAARRRIQTLPDEAAATALSQIGASLR